MPPSAGGGAVAGTRPVEGMGVSRVRGTSSGDWAATRVFDDQTPPVNMTMKITSEASGDEQGRSGNRMKR